jgi:hypothetical protein
MMGPGFGPSEFNTGINNIGVNQSIWQSAPTFATANAQNFGGWGPEANAFAFAAPFQNASQSSFVSASNGPFFGP